MALLYCLLKCSRFFINSFPYDLSTQVALVRGHGFIIPLVCGELPAGMRPGTPDHPSESEDSNAEAPPFPADEKSKFKVVKEALGGFFPEKSRFQEDWIGNYDALLRQVIVALRAVEQSTMNAIDYVGVPVLDNSQVETDAL